VHLSKRILDYRKKQTGTLRISENITFTNDDVMNNVIGASSKIYPMPPYTLIRLCLHRGDSDGVRALSLHTVMRRKYMVPSPNYVGHLDDAQ